MYSLLYVILLTVALYTVYIQRLYHSLILFIFSYIIPRLSSLLSFFHAFKKTRHYCRATSSVAIKNSLWCDVDYIMTRDEETLLCFNLMCQSFFHSFKRKHAYIYVYVIYIAIEGRKNSNNNTFKRTVKNKIK